MCEYDCSLSSIITIKCKLAAYVFHQFPFTIAREGLFQIAMNLVNQQWGYEDNDVVDPSNKHNHLTTYPGKMQAWISL
jgi:hypothetical protein